MGSLLFYLAHSCYETVVDKYKENVNTDSRMSNYFKWTFNTNLNCKMDNGSELLTIPIPTGQR
jgi:hypothetical protein